MRSCLPFLLGIRSIGWECLFHHFPWLLLALVLSLRIAEVLVPEVVADYIHAVIEADRTLYATHVVDRMQETGTGDCL